MWVDLFLCLYLAHLVADFVLQTNKICKNKAAKKWRSPYHYAHALIVFAVSWLVTFDIRFWWVRGGDWRFAFLHRYVEVLPGREGGMVCR